MEIKSYLIMLSKLLSTNKGGGIPVPACDFTSWFNVDIEVYGWTYLIILFIWIMKFIHVLQTSLVDNIEFQEDFFISGKIKPMIVYITLFIKTGNKPADW